MGKHYSPDSQISLFGNGNTDGTDPQPVDEAQPQPKIVEREERANVREDTGFQTLTRDQIEQMQKMTGYTGPSHRNRLKPKRKNK